MPAFDASSAPYRQRHSGSRGISAHRAAGAWGLPKAAPSPTRTRAPAPTGTKPRAHRLPTRIRRTTRGDGAATCSGGGIRAARASPRGRATGPIPSPTRVIAARVRTARRLFARGGLEGDCATVSCDRANVAAQRGARSTTTPLKRDLRTLRADRRAFRSRRDGAYRAHGAAAGSVQSLRDAGLIDGGRHPRAGGSRWQRCDRMVDDEAIEAGALRASTCARGRPRYSRPTAQPRGRDAVGYSYAPSMRRAARARRRKTRGVGSRRRESPGSGVMLLARSARDAGGGAAPIGEAP